MANYSAIKAAVNAYIKANGRKEITGMILNAVLNATIDSLGRYFQFAGGALPTDDPGTPDQNVCYLAGEPGVYTNFGGITIENEEVALLFWNGEWTKQSVLIGIREVNASVDNQVGTPSVDVSYSGGELVLTFHNLKGEQGETGDPAGFGTIGADINGGVGTPGVSVETSGDNTAKNLMFHFTNLKGETGVTSVVATIDNTSGTPACQVSLVNGVLTLAFSGLKGLKGDTGVSADYPITIYNGLDSDATDQALAAAQGKRLGDDLSQLEAKVTGNLMSARAKNALMAVFQKVAFTVPDVSAEMDELENALFNLDELVGIEAEYTQGSTVIWSDGVSSLDDLLPGLVVNAVYGDGTRVAIASGYTLSGNLTVGTSTITVEYQDFTDTFNVVVTLYGSKMSYVLSDGVALARAYSDAGSGNFRIGASSTTRKHFFLTYGLHKAKDSNGNETQYYPLPIPKTATSVTVTITQSTLKIGGYFQRYENGEFKNTLSTQTFTAGGFTKTLDQDGITQLYYVPGIAPASGNIPSGQPTAITIEFSNE